MNKMIDPGNASEFRSMIEGSKNIVLTCHVRPDGDAMGSTLGLMHLFRKLGKNVDVVTPDAPPRQLSFLPGIKEVSVYSRHEEYCKRMIGDSDLVVCCDFNKPSRQDSLAPVIEDCKAPKVLIDHHLDPDDFVALMFSYPAMSSTCELCVRVIAAMGLFGDVDRDGATCFLTGLITDTRNFTVNCRSVDIYEILTLLMEKGADKTMIIKEALERQSLWAMKLQAYALAEKMEVSDELHGALITLDAGELKRFHYEKGDTEGLVNEPLRIRGVYFCFFLREDEDCIKVSARSIGSYPVSEICEKLFGGGGHLNASGAEFHGSLEECRKILLEGLPSFKHYLPAKLQKIE